ncbi:beta-1,4-galactosyltransferase galt-1-like [Chaetodon trifascialis]|uniref:beta-1,4-galactosyltransferase galt-1-like n=1 Tax=Chaetodon trifascialis TaxID=109706 RepID=UPI003991BDDE
MDEWKKLRRKFIFLSIGIFILLVVIVTFPAKYRTIPKPIRNLRQVSKSCPQQITYQTITPLKNTKHLLVSAYMDQRVKDFDVRIISIFRRDSIQPLHCLFCCAGQLSHATTQAKIKELADNFGFPFATTNVMCQIPQNCSATHVSLLTQPDSVKAPAQIWLPIRNQKTSEKEEKKMQFDFTVCISNLFEFNNALQYAQTLEMYRLLGIDRVVIYNTSCGPDLDRLLQSYSEEGFVEMVPWPINQHLNPSRGWLFSQYGGDVHYFGQLATLNECIYRSMDRSRYVLLHDIDEIIMPYQHDTLTPLMDMLQQQHPKAGVFLVENHIYPKKPFEKSKAGPLPKWRGVPGFNILEHIYKWEPDRTSEYHPYKLIVQPSMVEQTSVHLVLEKFGEQFKIPPELCHIIHSPLSTPMVQPLERIQVDTRLWDFRHKLIPNVNNVLRRAGLLRPR